MVHTKRFACGFTISAVCVLGAFLVVAIVDSNSPVAAAGTAYGIQGQMAPELNLFNWIDGSGHKIDPIRLSDYQGKVVYLYFFQDW